MPLKTKQISEEPCLWPVLRTHEAQAWPVLGARSLFLGGTGFSLCFFAVASSIARHEAGKTRGSIARRVIAAIKIDLTIRPFPHGTGTMPGAAALSSLRAAVRPANAIYAFSGLERSRI